MHPSQRPTSRQQQRVQRHVKDTDTYAFSNLKTGPHLLDDVEALLPAHRERLFPPTEAPIDVPRSRLITEPRVGLRPGRVEPRALKRRPKAYPLLTKPRKRPKRRFARMATRKNGSDLAANLLFLADMRPNIAPFWSEPILLSQMSYSLARRASPRTLFTG